MNYLIYLIDFISFGIYLSAKTTNKNKLLSKVIEELLDPILASDSTTDIGCNNMTCLIVVLK